MMPMYRVALNRIDENQLYLKLPLITKYRTIIVNYFATGQNLCGGYSNSSITAKIFNYRPAGTRICGGPGMISLDDTERDFKSANIQNQKILSNRKSDCFEEDQSPSGAVVPIMMMILKNLNNNNRNCVFVLMIPSFLQSHKVNG